MWDQRGNAWSEGETGAAAGNDRVLTSACGVLYPTTSFPCLRLHVRSFSMRSPGKGTRENSPGAT